MSAGYIPNLSGMPGSWLTQQHPFYPKRAKWWRHALLSYKGGRDYYEPDNFGVEFDTPAYARNENGQLTPTGLVDTLFYNSMLFRHAREKLHEYNNRNRRAIYLNPVKQIVNSLVSHALKKPPARKGDDKLTEFWKSCDESRNTSIDTFIRRMERNAWTTGIWWICMDVDAEDGDGKPYVYGVNPLDIVDWHTDDDGNIQWLKQYILTEQEREPQQQFRKVDRYRVWFKDRVEDYENRNGSPSLVGERPNVIGRVPLEPLYAERSDDCLFPDGTSFASDLSKIANAIYNRMSLLDEIFYKQTFSWLIIPDPNQKLDAAQIGLNTAFGFDPGGQGGEPKYISPDADQARVLMEGVASLLEQARQVVGVGRGRQEGSMQKSSAEALELESEDKRALLNDVANEAEDAERRLVSLFRAYDNGAPLDEEATDDVYISYSREFDVASFEADIQQALSLDKLQLPTEVRAEYIKDLVRRRFASKPPQELDELLDSVDAHVEEMEKEQKAMRAGAEEERIGSLARGALGIPGMRNGPQRRPKEKAE